MSEIRVSVIVPVFNAEKYLGKALDSLAAQTLKNMEFILVDDAGTDNSRAIIEERCRMDLRFRAVLLDKNIGVAKARNRGIEAAEGEFIGFMDADDWIDPGFFEALYHAAQKEGSDMAKTRMAFEFENGRTKIQNTTQRRIRKGLAQRQSLFTLFYDEFYTAIYRRQRLEQHQIRFQDIRVAEDVVFLLYACYHLPRITLIDGPLYHYRQHSAGISKNYTQPYFEGTMEACRAHFHFARSLPLSQGEAEQVCLKSLAMLRKRLLLLRGNAELAAFRPFFIQQTMDLLKTYPCDQSNFLQYLARGAFYHHRYHKLLVHPAIRLLGRLAASFRS